MTPRLPRSPGDLKLELEQQLALLVHDCRGFDSGLSAAGKSIAAKLRLLVHHSGRSNALLQQTGYLGLRFLDTVGDLDPRNLATDCPLCFLQVGGGQPPRYVAILGNGFQQPRWVPFKHWWRNAVIKDAAQRRFSRRDVVSHLADTDGGAHVDAALDEAYVALSRDGSLGYEFRLNERRVAIDGPQFACARQIAHELLETMKANGVPVAYP